MDAFSQQLKDRLSLANAALELFHFAFDPQVTEAIYQKHRGRCYEDVLSFTRLLELLRDALLQHGGSANRLFTELERKQQAPVDKSNFYRKLANTPIQVSRALLRDGSSRLRDLVPPEAVELPACFAPWTAVAIDGKKIKKAAKRLLPTRGYSGKLIGAKALVALDLRRGLAIAMSESLDGEANDIPLVPDLMPQVHQVLPEPALYLADRQFSDAKTLRLLASREGDHFAVRIRKGLGFTAESTESLTDAQGREVIDEIGILGKGSKALPVRRVTLKRPGEDDVILLTDLMDRGVFPALDLLALYRHRWGIEQVFQQVTEVFALDHLIGSSPKAVLFQFAFCLLMYNLVQVVKVYVAEAGAVPLAIVSTYGLFYDLKRELSFWAYMGSDEGRFESRDAGDMRAYLREQLKDSWDPVAYRKASDKKPRNSQPAPKRLKGGHTSVQRLLDQAKDGKKKAD